MKDEKIQSYKPISAAEGSADLVVRISHQGNNQSESIAHAMYDLYFLEMTQKNEVPDEFTPNYVYMLNNGVGFRLFDDGSGPEKLVIEFGTDPDHPQDKQTLLNQIPDILRGAGVENERALATLTTTINTPARTGHG